MEYEVLAGGRNVPMRAAYFMVAVVCVAVFAGFGRAGAIERKAARPADGFPAATDVRVGGDDNQTRFVLDLSRKIDLRAFTLADPYRVVVDIPQVAFQLPPKTGEQGRGLVKAFRFGLVMQGGSRIVLDVQRPVRIDKAFILDAADGQPARLVLDLAATDRDAFMRNLALDKSAPRVTGAIQAQDPAGKPSGDPRPLVVIDPGHGGIDNGTRAPSGLNEKAIVLEFGLLLRDRIEKTGKYRVVMTRTDDTFVPLAERVRFARARQAALFISIHADALARGGGDAHGATENRADVIAGVDLSAEPNDIDDILIDLAQRETKTFSMQFARGLVGELKTSAGLHKQPLKSAGFRVLKAPDVPSVLIELGYVSSAEDLKRMLSDSWRGRTADSIVQAVDTYFTTRLAGARPGATDLRAGQ